MVKEDVMTIEHARNQNKILSHLAALPQDEVYREYFGVVIGAMRESKVFIDGHIEDVCSTNGDWMGFRITQKGRGFIAEVGYMHSPYVDYRALIAYRKSLRNLPNWSKSCAIAAWLGLVIASVSLVVALLK